MHLRCISAHELFVHSLPSLRYELNIYFDARSRWHR
jgi:hypothetical protein